MFHFLFNIFLQKERIFIACKFYLLGIHQEYMSGVLAFNFLLFVMMHTISFLLSACDMYHQHIYKRGAIYSEDVSTYMFGRKDRIIVVDDNKPFCAVFLCAYFEEYFVWQERHNDCVQGHAVSRLPNGPPCLLAQTL